MTRRTLADWRRDWDPLAWPAPWPLHSPGLIFACVADLLRVIVGRR